MICVVVLAVPLSVPGSKGEEQKEWRAESPVGGRERGDCHFCSHSAIQRKRSLKSPAAAWRLLPGTGVRRDALGGLCWAQARVSPIWALRPRGKCACCWDPVRKQEL